MSTQAAIDALNAAVAELADVNVSMSGLVTVAGQVQTNADAVAANKIAVAADAAQVATDKISTAADVVAADLSATQAASAAASVQRIPVTEFSTNLTLTAAHLGQMLFCTSATDVTVTLPEDATEALGDDFTTLFWQGGAGRITFVKEGTDTIRSHLSAVTTAGLDAQVSALRKGSSWLLAGTLV